MRLTVVNTSGSEVDHLEVDENVFGIPMNAAVVHQALVQQRANARVGTASAKTRSEVSGSSRKLYRQKHTGRARAGDLRSPLRRHGGVIFGPKPRNYRQNMPKKMRRLAIKCLLSAKVDEGEIKVIDKIEMENPRTKDMVAILRALDVKRSALIALHSPDKAVVKSADNLAGIDVIQARQLNVIDLLSHRELIITVDAIKQIESLWGERQTTGAAG
ncbi:MAG: 50S ribosomal protein L4 [Dehalococcoidia bacterium]